MKKQLKSYTAQDVIDIHSRSEGVAGELSNLTTHFGMYKGVPFTSPEGPIQAFKVSNPEVQRHICLFDGREAKMAGQEYNNNREYAWWNGIRMKRQSNEFQEHVADLYKCLAKNRHFRRSLLSTGDATLIHSIGTKDPMETILTEEEFCHQLAYTRSRLRSDGAIGIGTASPTLWEMDHAARLYEIDGNESLLRISELYGDETAAILAKADFERQRKNTTAFEWRVQAYGTHAAIQMEIYYQRLDINNGSPPPQVVDEHIIAYIWKNFGPYFF